MSGLKGSLARATSASAGTAEEIGALRRRAFVEHGVAMIHLSAVADPWTKQAVINEARRQLEQKPQLEQKTEVSEAAATAPQRRRMRR